ncbi:MAG: hypothetical protein H0T43_00240 [Solirubrobacterales bacterium]|nr:hypothetical protein [Solirubrobacterales bacterium]
MRTFLATLAILLALPSAALASGQDVIRDCTDDERFTKTYTQKEYRDALSGLSTDTDEYTNCRSVIRRAQLAAAGGGSRGGDGGSGSGGSGSGPGGASTPSAPADGIESASAQERKAIDDIRSGAGRPIALLGDLNVDPARSGSAPGVGQLGDLPTPVILLLALLAAGALALGATRIRGLVLARRTS